MTTERVGACPLCGDAGGAPLHTGLVDRLYGAPGRWDLHRCGGCGAAYLDPRPTPEAISATYETYYTHEPPPSTPPRTATRRVRTALRNGYLNARYGYALRPATPLGRLVALLLPGRKAAVDRYVRRLRRPREGARLLDVGCGNGEFLLVMRAAGWHAEGLEIDTLAAERARALGLDVRAGALEPGAYPPRSFDAVTMSHVLEHLHDPIATLRTARGVLRDDGVLWIATPYLASPGHARYGRAWRGLEPPRHLVLFTADALVRSLDRAGFRLVGFQRPASARWVYEASERLSRTSRSGALTARATDLRSARSPERGEELVVLAEPA